MSHLHRNLAANLAVQADPDTSHPCKPVVADAGELAPTNAPAAAARVARGKRAPSKKKRAKR